MNRIDIPFSYFGGKAYLAQKIIPFFPEHKIYVEPFCGCCNVLLQKNPSLREFASDKEKHLINFFRCIQDKEKLEQMLYWFENSVHHRGEYYDLMKEIESEGIDWKRAAYWFYILRYSFSGKWGQSWGYDLRNSNSLFELFQNAYPKLKAIQKRLQGVTFENRDFEFIIQNYDSKDTFFYCDPPYMQKTRSGGEYLFEMSYQEHEKLINLLKNIQGMCILSGYNNELYASLGWRREDFIHHCASKGAVKGQELKEKRSASRTESIWISPLAEKNHSQLSLFD